MTGAGMKHYQHLTLKTGRYALTQSLEEDSVVTVVSIGIDVGKV